MSTRTIDGRAWAELGLLALVWGASFLTVEIALTEIGPLTTVFWRVLPAAVALWIVALAQGHALPRDPRVWAAFAVMGLLNNVIPFGLISWGQTEITSGLASIFNATTAILGALVAALCLRDERLTRRRAAGVALGFAGVVVTIGPGALGSLDPGSLGQYAVLGAALSYAFASVWGRLRLGGVAPIVAAAGMVSSAAVVMAPVAVAFEGVPRLDLSPATWGALAYLSLAATAGAYLLYYRVLARAGAANLMLVTLLIPPLAILLGWAVLGEALAPRAWGGFALIAAGLAVIDGRVFRLLARPAQGG